ncbi:MAG TPA: TetR/AcrR family transcriptional regulator [Acidimicrobiales bacterium]|nr:TetR/AcrR family transcriptional regulator [Acidimicrobiales bacterium]
MTVVENARRTEILDAAADLFASAGIRASLKDIADAAGILPGSLYHHFDSKEAIVVELVQRYLADLDQVAQESLERTAGSPARQAVEEVGTAIAECAVRNRAALLLTFYEPPSVYGAELAELTARSPVAITAALREVLARADAEGTLRDGIDRDVLADRICQSMLHVGIGVFHRNRAARLVPALKCRMLLGGLAEHPVVDVELDRSPARQAADEIIAGWPSPDAVGEGGRAALILDAARAEFGRRGYEATTMRDVAAAAGVSAKAVYRVVQSKEELLMSILGSYADSTKKGWDAVLGARATPLEKLDALLWLDINILDRYTEESRIQSVGLQFAPPTSPDLGLSFPARLRQIRKVLADGAAAGEIRTFAGSADVRARCVFSLIWTPGHIVRTLGTHATLGFARDTLLRGAAE